MPDTIIDKSNGEDLKVNNLDLKWPILPIHEFEDVLIQLRADPNCRHCYGRGYLSFTKLPSGTLKMNLCPCATFGETEILKVIKMFGLISEQIDHVNNAVVESLTRIEKEQKRQGDELQAWIQRPSWFKQAFKNISRREYGQVR
jgi:hypothetical protein